MRLLLQEYVSASFLTMFSTKRFIRSHLYEIFISILRKEFDAKPRKVLSVFRGEEPLQVWQNTYFLECICDIYGQGILGLSSISIC